MLQSIKKRNSTNKTTTYIKCKDNSSKNSKDRFWLVKKKNLIFLSFSRNLFLYLYSLKSGFFTLKVGPSGLESAFDFIWMGGIKLPARGPDPPHKGYFIKCLTFWTTILKQYRKKISKKEKWSQWTEPIFWWSTIKVWTTY